KEPTLLVQQADEHRAKDECEHPKDECKKRGSLKVLPGKREGNHPDRGDQRRYEQDREKKDAEENQKRLEVSKDRATSHVGSSIDLNGQNPSAGNRQEAPVCGVPQSPVFGPLCKVGNVRDHNHGGADSYGCGQQVDDHAPGSGILRRHTAERDEVNPNKCSASQNNQATHRQRAFETERPRPGATQHNVDRNHQDYKRDRPADRVGKAALPHCDAERVHKPGKRDNHKDDTNNDPRNSSRHAETSIAPCQDSPSGRESPGFGSIGLAISSAPAVPTDPTSTVNAPDNSAGHG